MTAEVAEKPYEKMVCMATESIERKWAMTRVRKGDYICLSNDQQTVWRFHQHIDGRNLGLECNYNERTFWRSCYMPIEKARALGSDLYDSDPWDERVWIESDWHLPSRGAAVGQMLKRAPSLAPGNNADDAAAQRALRPLCPQSADDPATVDGVAEKAQPRAGGSS